MLLPSPRHRTRRRAVLALGRAVLALLGACAVALALGIGGAPGGGDAPDGAASAPSAGPVASEPRDPAARPAPRDAPRRPATTDPRPTYPEVAWRESTALGTPTSGSLARGVQVPREGRHFFTWDPVERTFPNRPWRRWGTDHAVRVTLQVLADHRRAHPRAPRLGIGDLSRPHGGDFGIAYGPIGHASHQNGLDVDVYYPLESGRERAPLSVEEIDLGLSQDLVDRFVAAGAVKVFVGPSTGLTGPPEIVQAIPNHDNHLHVRFPPEG